MFAYQEPNYVIKQISKKIDSNILYRINQEVQNNTIGETN